MVHKLWIVLVFLIFSSQSLFAQGIGAVNDSFKKDYRNVPYPRDNNTQIIDEQEIIKRLPDAASADRVTVSSFEFTGNRVINKKELKSVTDYFLNTPLTIRGLNEAADAVTALYREEGYIISYAYIPPQMVDNGIVTIAIVEGEIGEVIVEGASDYKKKFIQKHLTLLKSGIVLDIKNLERRLLLLNSYMDLEVRASLKPGEKPGSSDIVVYVSDRNPYRINLGFDNYGTKETNEYRFGAGAMIGNLLTSGDRLSLYLTMGLDNFNPEELFFGRIDYRLSFGGNGLKVGAAYARSNYKATDEFKILNLKGYSNEYSLYTEYPFLLKSNFTGNFRGEFNIKDSMDKILDRRNTADGIYKLAATVYGTFYPWDNGGGYYSLSLEQGINPLFNGSHNSGGSTRPDAGGLFEKLYGEIEFTQYFLPFLRLNFSFSGQYGSEEMFSPEKFYIGGIYSVRGFQSGINSGDSGYRLSLELETDVYIPQVKFVGFYDRGWVYNYSVSNWGYKEAELDSLGVGIRIYPYRGFALKVDYGIPVNATLEKLNAGTIYARISYDF